MSSSSSVVEFTVYHEKMSALVARLRGLRHWTQTECALRGGISRADVRVVEDLRPTTTAHWDRRIVALERAFDLPLREIVDEDMRPGRPVRVLPFVTATQSIHQNSFEWTGDGRMLDVADHAPQFQLMPLSFLRRWLGVKVPDQFLKLMQIRAHTRVTSAISRPQSLWTHYQRLINAAKKSLHATPLRYEARTAAGQQLLREVTCIRLSKDRYETRTHVISEAKTLDLPCCGRHDDCRDCMSAQSSENVKLLKQIC